MPQSACLAKARPWRSLPGARERNHSVELVPAIKELMGQVRTEMGELKAVFVARGPGGFSALRVGMSTAKALAVGLQVPLSSIPTLDIEAQPYMGLGLPVYAVIDAGRERLYVGRYETAGNARQPTYEVVSYDGLVSTVKSAALFCGEGVSSVADPLHERLGARARVPDVPPPTRRASVLAHLGYRRWQAGETDDLATLQPLYLRSAQVEAARRRSAPRAHVGPTQG